MVRMTIDVSELAWRLCGSHPKNLPRNFDSRPP